MENDNLSLSTITADLNTHLKSLDENKSANDLFIIKSAADWLEQAKTRPIPKMLFAQLWYEGEICILFADTNLGKSILAVQIGNSISKGEQIPGFKLETSKSSILYFDFELSDKQFENRYSSNFQNHYNFDPYFLRIEINPEALIPDTETFEDYLSNCMEQSIIKTEAKILIIDNLTYLKNETEKAKDALPLMKNLKALKTKYDLSILVLAHTPKRDLSKPISINDLSGSKMLMNFCDSAFSIGESNVDKNLRYIKQIKVRNTEKVYDSDNIALCQISKPFNFLQFEFVNFGRESEHLRQHTEKDKENLGEKVIELNKQGRSLREIGAALNISHMKVSRTLQERNTL